MMGQSRTALITGASAGLGSEFARQLATLGCDLVLVARRAERLQALADELIRAHGIRVSWHELDLTDPDAPQRLVAALETGDVQVDILINNAGAAGPDLLADTDWVEQRGYLELMMLSASALTHFLVPLMVERGYGRVINVASMAGRLMRTNDTNYGPAKAYLIAMSEAVASTVRGSGVRVLALCPGFTRTEFHAEPHMHALKAAIPKWLWYDAELVVREALRAMERGRLVYASGWLYRLVDPLTQSVFTRWLLRGVRRS